VQFLAGADDQETEGDSGDLQYGSPSVDPALSSAGCPPCTVPVGPAGWGWMMAALLGGGILGGVTLWAWNRYVR